MNPRGLLAMKLVVALLMASVGLSVWAQQPEPQADFPAPAAAEEGKPAAKSEPAAKKAPSPKKPAAEEKKTEEERPAVPDSPAVRAILANHPSTPGECAQAGKILADLGRFDLSKQFLARVLDAKPDENTLADLAEQLGSETLLNMAGRQELQPEAKQFADAALTAINRRLQDPQRLARLIEQLRDPSEQVRADALANLLDARTAAIRALIGVLADPSRAAEHAVVRAALARFESDAAEALVGLLEKADPKTVAQAIQVLAAMHVSKAAIYLLRPAISEKTDPEVHAAAVVALNRLMGQLPDRKQAGRLLAERAQEYFDRRQPLEREVAGQMDLWDWDVAQRQCITRIYAVDDASRVLAARLARDAFAIAPGESQIEDLYLATMFEEAASQHGLDQPWQNKDGLLVRWAAGSGTRAIESALEYAVAHGHPAAATVAAQVLGYSGQTEKLLYGGPQPTALVLATQNPDRRLRLAAAEAIVRLRPERPFAGSSYVPQALAFLAASSGGRHVLLGGSTQGSRELAGMIAATGLQTDTAVSGRQLVRMATASPDYELALIDSTIDRPTADLLLQELRGDCRSADLRVGLIARAGSLEQAERVAREDRLTLAFARPHDAQAVQWQLAQLAALRPREFVGHAERQRQAATALDLLSALCGSPQGVYDLRQLQDSVLTAVYNPALSTKAVAVLAYLDTAESQRALVELASRFTQPLEVRTAAVEAFRRNSQKYGLLLTAAEIRQQYDRYNQSESLDAATQRILGLILDCIEAPTRAVKSK